jgi:hypothetical protein
VVVAGNMPDFGDRYNICLVSGEQAGTIGEWHTIGGLEKVKDEFSGFSPDVRKLLKLAKAEDCYIWRLSEMPQLERWVTESGKVVIIGDAAHAMLPYAGMVSSSFHDYFAHDLLIKYREHLNVLKTRHVYPCASKERIRYLICAELWAPTKQSVNHVQNGWSRKAGRMQKHSTWKMGNSNNNETSFWQTGQ